MALVSSMPKTATGSRGSFPRSLFGANGGRVENGLRCCHGGFKIVLRPALAVPGWCDVTLCRDLVPVLGS